VKNNILSAFGLSLLASLIAGFGGCSGDDDNPAPSDPEVTGGSSGAGGTSAGGSGGNGTEASTSTNGSSGGSAGETGSTSTSSGGSAGETGSTSAGGSSSTTTSAGGSSSVTNTEGTTTTSTTGGLPTCDELGDDGCWDLATCTPAEEAHILNACSEGDCFAFDNVARLPLYNNGELPSVP